MFQSLNIFKSKAERVDALDDLERLMPKPRVAAEPDPATLTPKRGTFEDLKNVAGPSKDDIEADFAFMSDILAKAGVSEASTPVVQSERQAPMPAPAAAPQTSSVPKHVPHHKRGAQADPSKPVFAVQEGPRSNSPEPVVRETRTESPASVYDSIVKDHEESQLALPLAAPAPAEIDTPRAEQRVETTTIEAARVVQADEPQATPDMAAAFEILEMTPKSQRAEAPVTVNIDMAVPAEIAAKKATPRPSLFAKRVKAAARPDRVVRQRNGEADMDANFEPPALVRKLMSALPTTEIQHGVSEFAKTRLARDPFDRLMDDAQRC